MKLTPAQARERLEEAKAAYSDAVNEAALALAIHAAALRTLRQSSARSASAKESQEKVIVDRLMAAAERFEEARGAFATAELAIQGGRPE